MIGQTIGNYTLVSQLGAGGMGEVYLAEHPRIARKVAVKLLHAALSADRRLVERLFDEALATNLVKHPGIVQVFDCGFENDRAYLIMELLEGQSLAAWLRQSGPLPSGTACAIAAQIAAALAAAHDHQIVHRDLKPDNVFLLAGPADRPPAVKILDFGVAKLMARPSSGQTDSAMLLGTPAYMSPEQCAGARTVDARTDIYTLGGILFEMVTGRMPFLFAGWGEYIAAHQTQAPPAPASLRPGLDPALDRLILQMLAKRPDDRPSSMGEVRSRLLALQPGPEPEEPVFLRPQALSTLSPTAPGSAPTVRARSRGLWLGVGGALTAAIVAGALWWNRGPAPVPVDHAVAPPTPTTPTQAPPHPADPLVTIELTGLASEATLSLDGQAVTPPLKVARGSGVHTLLVQAPGFRERTLAIDADTPSPLAVPLAPLPVAPPAKARPPRPGRRERPRAPAPKTDGERFRGFEDL